MTDQPLTAADLLLQAATELQRCPETGNWPGTWRSPSQRKMNRPALERETGITWLLPEAEARALPWVRERFWSKRPRRPDLIAYSTDARGRCIRCWLSRPEDQQAYERLVRAGAGTAPIEAVHPATIEPGKPAAPAHPFLAPLMYANIAASEGTPVKPPATNMQPSPQKLALIESAFWEGLRPR